MTSAKDNNLELQLQQIENILDLLKQQLQGIKKYEQHVPVMELELLQHNVNTLAKSVSDLPVESAEEKKEEKLKVSNKATNTEPQHTSEDLLSEIGVKVNEEAKEEVPDMESKSFVEEPIEAKVASLSIHEKITEQHEDKSLASHHQTKKLESLKDTIGLNEKFLFISDLFHGKNSLYNQAIKKLDGCESIESAMEVVLHHVSELDDKKESPAYSQFIELLTRRYRD